MYQQFCLAEICDQPKLGYEHSQEFKELSILNVSLTVLHVWYQNYAGIWYTTTSRLNKTVTCHTMFAFSTCRFSLDMPSVRIISSCWRKVQNFKISKLCFSQGSETN